MAQINKPTDYFTTFLWTGDGASTRSITGVGLQADMMWSKIRNVGHQHNLVDTVRGVNQRLLSPNATGAEDTTGTQGYFNSLDSDGFSLTYGGAGGYNTNRNGDTYVGWFWKANGAGSSNTDGSITSTVSADTTSGFSVVSYSGGGSFGDTVGHGLGAVPAMIIVKTTNATSSWYTWQKAMGATDNQFMDFSNGALQTSGGTIFDVSAMSSTTFTLGTNSDVNGSGSPKIAYCFAEKKGFSKFGSYVGNNGGTDGVFVYTGFKPALVIQKLSSNAGGNWLIRDNKRNTFNTVNSQLEANTGDAEETNHAIDFLSNGFKTRANGLNQQDSGYTYIYMAFAENPLVASNYVPTTAR